MSQLRRSFYNGWTSQSSTNLHRRRNSPLSSINENEDLEEQLFHLEKDLFSVQRDISEMKDEMTLLRYDTTKISEYLKDVQKLSTYERELQLLQIKNVVLETLPNLVTQIVPEIVRSFSLTRGDLEYPEEEEEEIPASHIQDICDKTTISVCSEPFLCSICHTDVNDNEVIRKVNHCSHSFHIQCLETWLSRHNNCPLCRYQI